MEPEEILPDEQNVTILNGTAVRKGSVGAFLANARILGDAGSSPAGRERALGDLLDLVPALSELGLFDVFGIRDPALAVLVEQVTTRRRKVTKMFGAKSRFTLTVLRGA